jgi:hypothetical protein
VSVSKAAPVSEAETTTPALAVPADPRRNPSYPARIHVAERAMWEGGLRSCEDRIAPYGRKLAALAANAPDRPRFERLYAQMLGARDQVADAVRRLPGEVGALYVEDRHRLEEARAALERVIRRWDGA